MRSLAGCLLVALLLCGWSSAGEAVKVPKIGVVRLREVFNAYEKANKLRSELADLRDKRQKEIDALEEQIRKLKDELAAADLLTEDARSAKQAELDGLLRQHRDLVKTAQGELNDKEDSIIADVGQDIRSAVTSYAKIQDYDLIIDSTAVISFDASMDITDEIIKQMNALYEGGASGPSSGGSGEGGGAEPTGGAGGE